MEGNQLQGKIKIAKLQFQKNLKFTNQNVHKGNWNFLPEKKRNENNNNKKMSQEQLCLKIKRLGSSNFLKQKKQKNFEQFVTKKVTAK